jgi:magnesium transporter
VESDWLLARLFLENHPYDAALLLEDFSREEAVPLLRAIDPRTAAPVLEKMTSLAAAECLLAMPPVDGGRLAAALPLEAAARILRCLPAENRERFLADLSSDASVPLRRILRYPHGTAGALMDPQVLSLPNHLPVSEALARVQRSPEHTLYYLYVVDGDQKLVGVLNLRELMLARSSDHLASIMRADVAHLPARSDLVSILAHPGWLEVHALPVVDEEGTFLGVLRYKTLRRLEREAAGKRSPDQPLSTLLNLGELCWIGFAGMLAGLAATMFPEVIQREKESARDRKY